MEYDEDGKPLPERQLREDREGVTPEALVGGAAGLSKIHRMVSHVSQAVTLPSESVQRSDVPKAGLTVVEMAKRGGHARWAKLSPARRSEIARAAAVARWGKKEG